MLEAPRRAGVGTGPPAPPGTPQTPLLVRKDMYGRTPPRGHPTAPHTFGTTPPPNVSFRTCRAPPPRNAENPPGHYCPDGFSSVCQIEDSNFCRREPADLQSAPFGRSGNLANFSTACVVRYTLYYDIPSKEQIGCSGHLNAASRRGGLCSWPAVVARRWRRTPAGGRSGTRPRRGSGGRRQAHADAPGSAPGAPGTSPRPRPR